MKFQSILAVIILLLIGGCGDPTTTTVAATSANSPRQSHPQSHDAYTSYDPSLGSPTVDDDTGDATFTGKIKISGRLRIEREDLADASWAFAMFVPDDSSKSRLPRRITPIGVMIDIDAMTLNGGAESLLTRFIGAHDTHTILARPDLIIEVPAVVTISGFQIGVACDGTYYRADVIDMSFDPARTEAGDGPMLGGC